MSLSRPRAGVELDYSQYPHKKLAQVKECYRIPKIRQLLISNWTTPAGENLLGKTRACITYSAVIGSIMGVFYAWPIKTSKSLGYAVYYFGMCFVPAVAVGATYGAVTNIAGQFRNKDDGVNHFIGGFTAGSIMGLRFRCHWSGLGWAMGLGILGAVVKNIALSKQWDGVVYFHDGWTKRWGLRHNHHIDTYFRREHSVEGFIPPDK